MEDRYIELAILFTQAHDELLTAVAHSRSALEQALDRRLTEAPPPGWAADWRGYRQDPEAAFPPPPLLARLPEWAQRRYRLLAQVAGFVQLARQALRTSQEGYYAAFERGMRRGFELHAPDRPSSIHRP